MIGNKNEILKISEKYFRKIIKTEKLRSAIRIGKGRFHP